MNIDNTSPMLLSDVLASWDNDIIEEENIAKQHPIEIVLKMVKDFEREARSSNERRITIDLEYDIEPMLMYLTEALNEINGK